MRAEGLAFLGVLVARKVGVGYRGVHIWACQLGVHSTSTSVKELTMNLVGDVKVMSPPPPPMAASVIPFEM